MDSNGPGWHKSFANVKHHASAVGQDGLVLSSLLNISFHLRGFQSSLHHSIHKTYLTNMRCSIFKINTALFRSTTEMVLPQPYMSVNRSPNEYDFHGGAKANHYSVNIALKY